MKSLQDMRLFILPRAPTWYWVSFFDLQFQAERLPQFSNFVMTSGSILLQLDGTLNNYSAPELANAGSFVLPIGKSRTFTFAFTPDSATVAADAKSLYRRMEMGEFYLCISLVPERRLIRMPQTTV